MLLPGIVLVTGGSRGIGAAIVRAAIADGAAVGFSYVNDRMAARRLVDELQSTNARVHAVQGDVADPEFAARFVDECTGQLGEPGALVNNAGITGRYGAFLDLPIQTLRRTFEVNAFGAMMLTQEVVRRWHKSNAPGVVVNISSVAATLGSPGEYVHYAASKAALDAFTIGLGKELAPTGIRVNAVAAGTVLTEIHASAGVPDRPTRVAPLIPMKRAAQADEIARVVIWLLSGESSYVTGSVVRVSGGL